MAGWGRGSSASRQGVAVRGEGVDRVGAVLVAPAGLSAARLTLP